MYRNCKALFAMMAAVGAMTFAPTVAGHGNSHAEPRKGGNARKTETAFGHTGDPADVSRTIEVGMDDTMHFTPGDIVIRRGATIRFKVSNSGKLMHEMVIGTMKELEDHAELMRKFPGMEHDEPYMAHVAPGKEEVIVWQFTKLGEYHYACLIPGHLEAGMIGKVEVTE
jgi:uncharacterized cupredoxin-like copper-binding protein